MEAYPLAALAFNDRILGDPMDLGLIDLAGSAQEVIQQFTYLGPFLILLLCGLGLPLPEEVTLIGSGLLVYRGEADFVLISLTCSAAILLGDSVPYWLGHHYGKSVLRIRWVRRLVHPERLARLEKRFLEHGNWATFICRFLPGIRIPGYFVAGTMGMPYWRFLGLDALGVAISVPISIHLGRLFGGQIDRLKEQMEHLHLVLGFLVAALAITLVMAHRRNKQADGRVAQVPEMPDEPRPAPPSRAVDDPGAPD